MLKASFLAIMSFGWLDGIWEFLFFIGLNPLQDCSPTHLAIFHDIARSQSSLTIHCLDHLTIMQSSLMQKNLFALF